MIRLDSGNVLLKPSHRKQVMAWLRRAIRMGERLGHFILTVSLRRCGKVIEVSANVRDSAGDFAVRIRQHDLHYAMRKMAHALASRLNMQRLKAA
jgi:hypothetical protein